MPLFTLATITLNNKKGLDKTKKSIKKQDFKDFEWLVQDGGSTDKSLTTLDNTLANIESKPDTGIYNAMNRLIERSSGKYILFLNAGDALAHATTLQTIKNATANNPDFIYGDAYEEIPCGKHLNKTARSHKSLKLGMFTHHQSMLYKSEKIQNLRYDETYKIAADYAFTIQFLKTANAIEYIAEPLCVFEQGGISQQQTTQGRKEQFEIRKNLNLCAPLENNIITMLQSINMQLRTRFPNLYWSLKNL